MNKLILRFLGVVIFLLLLLFGSYVMYQQPNYNGKISVNGIGGDIDIYYDAIGVPHIQAETQNDAYIALGFVHAQDRLWQMEVLRRIASGKLSELFGEETIEVDRFFKSLCIEEAAAKTIINLDTTSKEYMLTKAYLLGVNEYIKNGKTPVEFHLLGLEKEKYELKDVYNVFGYMAFSFAIAHKTDPMLSALKSRLGDVYLRDLPIGIDSLKTAILGVSSRQNIENISTSITTVLDDLSVPLFIGSNAWVVGPTKTASGKVIFENDPHIGFSQPSVWYQAHLKTPNYESYGFHLGLTPFPMLAHNRDYAFGITMFENDDVDFYEETENPQNSEEYLYKGESIPYTITEKTILVKDADPIHIKVKKTLHGPIVNSVISEMENTKPISMDWLYTSSENKLLKASYGMSHATSLYDFKNYVSMIHAPGLNIMYGDSKGNIAWWAAAKLMEHTAEVNPKFILNGSDGIQDQLISVDFSKNPQAVNPKSNFVYSANNQSFAVFEDEGEKVRKGYYGYYLPEDRGKRIIELLTPKNDITREDMMQMTLDINSSTAHVFLNYFPLKELSSNSNKNIAEAARILISWKGDFPKESIAATIYMKLIYVYLKETLQDEMGVVLFESFLNTPIQKRTVKHLIENETSIWWDNINTLTVEETRKEIVTSSFLNTISVLEEQLGKDIYNWNWGSVHSLEHKHPMGQVPLLRTFLNVGPFENNGSNEVLNCMGYTIDSTGVYKTSSGPSTRRVIDFSDIENSKAILPTGQSGNPFSKHYKDQSQKYLNGEFLPMLLNKKEIESSENHLMLLPK